jgi:hypothetical protein
MCGLAAQCLDMRRLAVVLVMLVAGCGGSGDDDPPKRAEPPPAQTQGRTTPAPAPADTAAAERVIRSWLAAVREADFKRAGSFFARGARVRNGGPTRTLDDPALAIAWNATLPCGANLVGVTPAPKGFVIAEFELTERRGGMCGSGLGAPASSRIKVKDGQITDWYRVADEPPPDTVET